MCKITNMPIKWFGDRKAYFESDIKIVTVGLNPSDQEFVNCSASKPGGDRFPNFDGNIHGNTLHPALDEYFKINNYKTWFSWFEGVLNGMDASYYDDKKYLRRVIHTDLCTWWATNPTWSGLGALTKAQLIIDGIEAWKILMLYLHPDIILFGMGKGHYKTIVSPNTIPLYTTNNGIDILYGAYNGSLAIFGNNLRGTPFGGIDENERNKIGQVILNEYNKGNYNFNILG